MTRRVRRVSAARRKDARISGTRGQPPPRDEYPGSPRAGADILICAAIFVFALGIRLLYLTQIESTPLFYYPVGDGRVYDEWAQRIASGDLLGDGVFYQAPLYPYFLGFLQSILGHDLWSIRLVQITLGAVSCALIFLAGKTFFGRGAGVAAGVILSLYAPAIFYDALIQKAVLDLFLISLFLLLAAKSQMKPRSWKWVASGALLGLLALSRENALVWAFGVPVWIWIYFCPQPTTVRAGWVTGFLLGCCLVLLPVGMRNLIVGGEFALTTAQLGPNLYIGNNPDASGAYVPLRAGHGDARFERRDATELAEAALGRSLSPNEVSWHWLTRAFDYMLSQPGDWLALMGKKWLLVWNVLELEDADDFYIYQRWSHLLAVLGAIADFGLLAILAAAGCALTWKRWRQIWLLYLLLVSFAAGVALTYVFGRYRFPLVPILTLFAGVGIVECGAIFRGKRLREGVVAALVAAAAAVVVYWPVMGRPGPSSAGYNNLANALARQGQVDRAIESYQLALALEPTSVVTHFNLGNALLKKGDLKAAARHFQEAIRLGPEFPEAYGNAANVMVELGDLEGAIEILRKAVAADPRRAEGYYYLGTALGKQGQLAEAVEYLSKAIAIQPDYPEAYHHLGMVLAAQDRLDKAVAAFQTAVELDPHFAEAQESLAHAFSQMGKKPEAIKHYEEALRIMKSQNKPSGER
jgi:tetratricopeptide (TPR) repeat protein